MPRLRKNQKFSKQQDQIQRKRPVEELGNITRKPLFRRFVFGGITIFLSLSLSLLAVELVLRRLVEGSWSAVFGGLVSGDVPYSELGTDQWVISDPDLGYRLNPRHPETNTLGLRNPEISVEKPAGMKRILVVGDSISAGADGFVAILREKLRDRVQVINCAVPGYTLYQERVYIERDLLRLEPDLVILQYCTNDHHKFLHRFDPEAQLLITEEARWVMVADGNDPLFWLPHNSYLAFRLRLALLSWHTRQKSDYPWDRLPDFAAAWRDESWGEFRRHFIAIHEVVTDAGSGLVLIAAPLAAQFDPGMLAHDPEYVLKPQLKLAALCKEANVPMLDLYRVFYQKRGWGLYQGDGIHFSAKGHQVTADALMEFLDSQKLISGT